MHVLTILETGPAGTVGALRALVTALDGVPDAAFYEAKTSTRGAVKKLEVRWAGEPETGEIPVQRSGAHEGTEAAQRAVAGGE